MTLIETIENAVGIHAMDKLKMNREATGVANDVVSGILKSQVSFDKNDRMILTVKINDSYWLYNMKDRYLGVIIDSLNFQVKEFNFKFESFKDLELKLKVTAETGSEFY